MYLTLESEIQNYTVTDEIDLVSNLCQNNVKSKNSKNQLFQLDDSCELASLAAATSTCYG